MSNSKRRIDIIAGLSPQERVILRIKTGLHGECWPYRGETNNRGYGMLDHRKEDGTRQRLLAHRAVIEFLDDPIPLGIEVRHSCDNPPCCNPAHLSLGTHQENMDDARKRRRMGRRPGMRLIDKLPCIRAFVVAGVTRRQVARWFQVSPQAITSCLKTGVGQ